MTSVIVRIALRYLAAVLVAKGLLDPDGGSMLGADPDVAVLVETGVGIACGVAAEGWWLLARRMGWER